MIAGDVAAELIDRLAVPIVVIPALATTQSTEEPVVVEPTAATSAGATAST
jgi:hypothetical protein